jgi:hypothetical protein
MYTGDYIVEPRSTVDTTRETGIFEQTNKAIAKIQTKKECLLKQNNILKKRKK